MTTSRVDAERRDQIMSSGNGEDKLNVFYNSSFQRECRALRGRLEEVREELYRDTRSIEIRTIRDKLDRTRQALHQDTGGLKDG